VSDVAAGRPGERSLYGFTVRTGVPLRFLRPGPGIAPIDVVAVRGAERPVSAPLIEWELGGNAYPVKASLHEIPGGYEYWTADAGRFTIDLANRRIEMPAEGDAVRLEQRLNGMPMVLSFIARGDLSIHAAAVEVNGGALILAAPSKSGKTTLAFAFHRHGHRLLSEDLVCCRAGSAEIYPGPALARMRPDVYSGVPPAGMHEAAARPDRIFLALDDDRRGTSAPLPVRGIFFLREEDELRCEQVPKPQAIPDVWPLAFRIPKAVERATCFRQITQLVGNVPVWNAFRPLRLDALEATVEMLAEAALRSN
jgi:hypothetical protein